VHASWSIAGASIQVRASAGNKKIPSGVLNVDVQFMGTPIFQTTWDLCSKTKCPITPGELKIEYAQTLPPVAPPARSRGMRHHLQLFAEHHEWHRTKTAVSCTLPLCALHVKPPSSHML
jgi:hypothetical protein